MTNKEYIKEHLKSLRKDFDIAIKNNLEDYANKLVEEIKCSEKVLKDLEALEILKPRIYIEEGLYREDFQDDRLRFGKDFFDSAEQENTIKEWLKETKEYEKQIEETMEEYYDKCGIPKKYRNPNNIPGEIKIPTVTKNNLEKIKKIKGEEIMENIKLNIYDVVIITDKLGNIWQESIETIENMKDKVVYTTGKFYIEDVKNNRIITAKNNLEFDNLHIIEVYRLTKQFTQIY